MDCCNLCGKAPCCCESGPKAAARYKHLEARRSPFVSAAEAAARYTLPSVFPPVAEREQPMAQTKIVTITPWQNIGSRGVNNLASKLLLALLPPSTPFFRFILSDAIREKVKQDPATEHEVDSALAKMERRVMEEIEGAGARVDVFEMLRHLVVTGNYLLFTPIKGALKGFDLGSYVVRRDRRGTVLEIVVREGVDRKSAEKRVKEIIEAKVDAKDEKPVFLFTHIELDEGGTYRIYQEVANTVVPGSQGSYPADKLPWMCLRFRKIEGEDYGRGLVEENIGDLKSLESLTQSIVEGSAASAKLLFGVKPGALTNPRTLVSLKNGEFFAGAEGDVWPLQINKGADLNVAATTAQKIEEQLKFVFLMNTAVQRKGERVTAEEIRYMAGELDDSLGGVYSILTQEFQLPLVKRFTHRLQRTGVLPVVKEQDLKPMIVTGLEAIGRQQDIGKLRGLAEDIGILAQIDPTILQLVDTRDMLRRMAVARGVEESVVKSDDQVAQEQQAQQQAAMQQQVVGTAVQALGKGAEQGAKNLADQVATPEGASQAQQMMAQMQQQNQQPQ
jgi:hypothetical protein